SAVPSYSKRKMGFSPRDDQRLKPMPDQRRDSARLKVVPLYKLSGASAILVCLLIRVIRVHPGRKLPGDFGVAVGFIEQAQAFHEQALGGTGAGGFGAGFGEVDLEVAVGPAHGLVDGVVALHVAENRVRDLAFAEVQVAFLAVIGEGEQAA